jgi:hypothetical protein
VEVDRAYVGDDCRSHSLDFIGRLVRTVDAGQSTMRFYEWADLGRLHYLVNVEEHRSGRSLRRALYPFINTHSEGTTPREGYTAKEVFRAYPEFAVGKPRYSTGTHANGVEIVLKCASDFE